MRGPLVQQGVSRPSYHAMQASTESRRAESVLSARRDTTLLVGLGAFFVHLALSVRRKAWTARKNVPWVITLTPSCVITALHARLGSINLPSDLPSVYLVLRVPFSTERVPPRVLRVYYVLQEPTATKLGYHSAHPALLDRCNRQKVKRCARSAR